MVNYGFYSRNVMAREKALYRGHAVAAVAAVDPQTAEEALALLDVEYEVPDSASTAGIRQPVLRVELVRRSVAPVGSSGSATRP